MAARATSRKNPRLLEKLRNTHPGYVVWPGGGKFKKLGDANAHAKSVSLRDVGGQAYVGDADTEEIRGEWVEGKKVASNPRKLDRCVKKVKAKGGAKNAYAVCKAALKKNGKRNPAEASAEAFEEFHGYAPEEVIKVTRDRHHHKHLAAAGELVGLLVRPVDKSAPKKIENMGPDAMLCFNERKNQLFIENANGLSDASLRKFGITTIHEIETIGKLKAVGYFTDKEHLGDEGGEAIYSHTFRTTNENGVHITVRIAREPDLIYRVLDQYFEISGGSYEILREGIDK